MAIGFPHPGGVLSAPLGFVARLERPALHFLKERLAGHFCAQESVTTKSSLFFIISYSHSGIAGARRAGFAVAS